MKQDELSRLNKYWEQLNFIEIKLNFNTGIGNIRLYRFLDNLYKLSVLHYMQSNRLYHNIRNYDWNRK